jgi:Tol biopolymer transport system component
MRRDERASQGRALVLVLWIVLGPPAGFAQDPERAKTPQFVVETNPFVIGQAPDWVDRTHVVWHDTFGRDEDGDGDIHIYRSTLDGGEKTCLTCGLEGPNQVPVVQPRGKWILFHSWNGKALKVGAPGFGGIGSDLWVMTRDGQQRTNLTPDTEFHDNFHAYWSPDGKYVVWTALSWNKDEGGVGKSDIRVARFDPSGPRLVDEHVVRPGNGHWYETQWWAPDGSGFLYTETADTAVNPELFFCRLRNPARGACQPVRLTRDPAWDEQAIFTPDMTRVVFMSSRNLPGAHNDWAKVAELLDLPADYDHVLILLVFSDSYLQPVFQQATDLYELELRWNRGRTRFKPGTVRRLTETGRDGWVIPEFAWDPTGRRLLWTQNRFPVGVRVDQDCIVRQIRGDLIGRLSGVHEIAQIPLGIQDDIRTDAAKLLAPPRAFPFQGRGCGGDVPPARASFAQETRIGHFAR